MFNKFLNVGLTLALLSLPALAMGSDKTRNPPIKSLSKTQKRFLKTAVGTLNKGIYRLRKVDNLTARTMLNRLEFERTQLIGNFNYVRRYGDPRSGITIKGNALQQTAKINGTNRSFVLTRGLLGTRSFTANRHDQADMPLGHFTGAIMNPRTTFKVKPSIWGQQLEMKYGYDNMDYSKGHPVEAGTNTVHTLSVKTKGLSGQLKESWKRNTAVHP